MVISVWCILLDTQVSVPIYRVPIRKKIQNQQKGMNSPIFVYHNIVILHYEYGHIM
jgi:hypothetical protein